MFPVLESHLQNKELFLAQLIESEESQRDEQIEKWNEQFAYHIETGTCDRSWDECMSELENEIENDASKTRKVSQMASKENGNGIAVVDPETSLSIYDRMSNPIDAIKELGKTITLSKMFKCDYQAQGELLAWECLTRRCTPLTLLRENHLIQNTLSQKYDSMLAKFNAQGGTHKVVCRTADKAAIELSYNGQTINESLTWEEAQQEAWPYEKDGKELKKNWRTPRARRQMLWARVVSEGVRTILPGVNYGIYTDEEVDGFDPSNPAPAKQEIGEVVDAEYEVVPSKTTESQAAETESPSDCTAAQRDAIRAEFSRLEFSKEAVDQLIAKHGNGNTELRQLTGLQAEGLLLELATLQPKTTQGDWEPCTEITANMIKQAIAERQDKALVVLIKANLTKHGKQKIADMAQKDAEVLLESLKIGNLDAFFERSLASPPKESANEGNAKN